MSNLTGLVPPLELCRKIPAGEFADSAFYWFADLMQINETPPHEYKCTVHEADYKGYNWGGFRCCPAPTLQEILEVLPPYGKNEKILACCVPDWADFNARVFGEHWRVGYTGDCSINDKNPATAALKLWLQLKGIVSDQSEPSDLSETEVEK